ncbi:hypothetical protein [Brumicola nitratireducens]|uniref:Uncharacterized protein n=1 Tax=Glaciecola nitratireducens (strain JCM 12485 / KCTC 12276 / FR1064) TaxID=1085623 RepID=G4QIX0_GLANF|nr:hypothetical protein [Glaciecola nitratireducens]AEP28309.1 hypothetical protein GNIT_0155 [Glaciecola nitratireducens FR1064]
MENSGSLFSMYYSTRKGLFFALLSLAVFSQETHAESVEVEIVLCSKESNPLERLVCFDKIAEQINASGQRVEAITSSAPVQVVPPVAIDTDVNSIPEENALISLPETEVVDEVKDEVEDKVKDEVDSFGLPQASKDLTVLDNGELNSVIKKIQRSPRRPVRFILENGQVWENSDNSTMGLPSVGDAIVISPGALGSFYLRKADINRTFKVKRIRI